MFYDKNTYLFQLNKISLRFYELLRQISLTYSVAFKVTNQIFKNDVILPEINIIYVFLKDNEKVREEFFHNSFKKCAKLVDSYEKILNKIFRLDAKKLT
ncbi:hypothetical protein BpHYR1_002984 [Brachionus plicatilis]|uniref:Uncharacterized protein n=1 Tax=Brachionus plicatilis TaxID=10195 RepID=A0A3M7RUE6_BRAPC|nr:hypothetical protein BpHYR1_002984 [Brachionus plicatilis]